MRRGQRIILILALALMFILPFNTQTICSQEVVILPQANLNPVSELYYNETVTLTATATESGGSDISSVSLVYSYTPMEGDIENNSVHLATYSIDYGAPWEWEFDFPEGKGTYRMYTVAVDSDGDKEYSFGTGSFPYEAKLIYLGDKPSPDYFNYIILFLIVMSISVILIYYKTRGSEKK